MQRSRSFLLAGQIRLMCRSPAGRGAVCGTHDYASRQRDDRILTVHNASKTRVQAVRGAPSVRLLCCSSSRGAVWPYTPSARLDPDDRTRDHGAARWTAPHRSTQTLGGSRRRGSGAAADCPAELVNVPGSDSKAEKNHVASNGSVLGWTLTIEFERSPSRPDKGCSYKEPVGQRISCPSPQHLVLVVALDGVEPITGCGRAFPRQQAPHNGEPRHSLAPERLGAVTDRYLRNAQINRGHRSRCRPTYVGDVDYARIPAAEAFTRAREYLLVEMRQPAQPIDCLDGPAVVRLTHGCNIEPGTDLSTLRSASGN